MARLIDRDGKLRLVNDDDVELATIDTDGVLSGVTIGLADVSDFVAADYVDPESETAAADTIAALIDAGLMSAS